MGWRRHHHDRNRIAASPQRGGCDRLASDNRKSSTRAVAELLPPTVAWSMKTKTIFSLVSLALFAAVSPTVEARGGGGGGAGGGGGFHGGGFGGAHFAGSGGFHAGGAPTGGFHSSGLGPSGGVRYSFGTRPTYGQPVYVRPRGAISSGVHSPAVGRQQGPVSSTENRLAPFYHLPAATRYHSPAATRPSNQPVESAKITSLPGRVLRSTATGITVAHIIRTGTCGPGMATIG